MFNKDKDTITYIYNMPFIIGVDIRHENNIGGYDELSRWGGEEVGGYQVIIRKTCM
jgi:hypothetical protein